MAKALSTAFEPVFAWMAKRYQARAVEEALALGRQSAAVGAELKKYGLRYDDLLDPLQSLDTEEALRRLPQEEVDLRNQRLKRAMDLSMKHVYLPQDMQDKQTPFNHYLQPTLDQVKAERAERASLGAGQPYNRQIP